MGHLEFGGIFFNRPPSLAAAASAEGCDWRVPPRFFGPLTIIHPSPGEDPKVSWGGLLNLRMMEDDDDDDDDNDVGEEDGDG